MWGSWDFSSQARCHPKIPSKELQRCYWIALSPTFTKSKPLYTLRMLGHPIAKRWHSSPTVHALAPQGISLWPSEPISFLTIKFHTLVFSWRITDVKQPLFSGPVSVVIHAGPYSCGQTEQIVKPPPQGLLHNSTCSCRLRHNSRAPSMQKSSRSRSRVLTRL